MPSTPPPAPPPSTMPPPSELDDQYTHHPTLTTTSDPQVEARRHAAENRLLNASAKFLNHAGEAVKFADLDFDLIVGMLNAYTYPLDGVESVPVEMRPRVNGAAGRPGEEVGAVQSTPPQSVRPRRTPYEIVAYVDGARTQVRRRQPGIERTWHASKWRRALSVEMWEEVEEPFTM